MPGHPGVLCGRHRGHEKIPDGGMHRQRGADGGATWPKGPYRFLVVTLNPRGKMEGNAWWDEWGEPIVEKVDELVREGLIPCGHATSRWVEVVRPDSTVVVDHVKGTLKLGGGGARARARAARTVREPSGAETLVTVAVKAMGSLGPADVGTIAQRALATSGVDFGPATLDGILRVLAEDGYARAVGRYYHLTEKGVKLFAKLARKASARGGRGDGPARFAISEHVFLHLAPPPMIGHAWERVPAKAPYRGWMYAATVPAADRRAVGRQLETLPHMEIDVATKDVRHRIGWVHR